MKEILDALRAMKGQQIEPNLIRQVLETLQLRNLNVDEYVKKLSGEALEREIILKDPVEAFILKWPPQFFYPIHQHSNFWGFVVPLQGILSETLYGYAPNKRKVFIHPTKTFRAGEIVYEPYKVIHKLQNTSPIESLITLHVYYPPVYNFKGTSIFDAKNRRLAILNEKAETLSWDLPEDQYESIEENAYDLEKLW
jgi:predicted metal-dependent enzyme (double-stranded beta helix superfamily)